MATTKTCICAQCGAQFDTNHKRKYCSTSCRPRQQGTLTRSDYLAKIKADASRMCPECGELFLPTRGNTHSKGPQIFCSVTCSHAESNRQTKRTKDLAKEIAVYHKWGLGYGRGIHATKYQRWGARSRVPCIDCGNRVGVARTKIRPALRCGECADNEQLKLRRISRKRRKAMVRGASTSESVDPIKVFDRDGWKCHLCTKPTLKDMRGSYHPRAPELDHIIPLSKGGEHSYRNTACACRKCNAAKSDKIIGQPSLLAA